jgi:hypothetical protein
MSTDQTARATLVGQEAVVNLAALSNDPVGRIRPRLQVRFLWYRSHQMAA